MITFKKILCLALLLTPILQGSSQQEKSDPLTQTILEQLATLIVEEEDSAPTTTADNATPQLKEQYYNYSRNGELEFTVVEKSDQSLFIVTFIKSLNRCKTYTNPITITRHALDTAFQEAKKDYYFKKWLYAQPHEIETTSGKCRYYSRTNAAATLPDVYHYTCHFNNVQKKELLNIIHQKVIAKKAHETTAQK